MRSDTIIKKRKVKEDSIYESEIIGKFVNFLMKNGEKKKAEKIIYLVLEKVEKELEINKENLVSFFSTILEKITCNYELRKMKFGGATYQVPIETLERRKQGIAMRLLVKQSKILSRNNFSQNKKTRSGTKMHLAMFKEIKNIHENMGGSLKHKEQLLKTVQANKAYMSLFNRRRKRNKNKSH